MNFVAIDFETATTQRNSPCAIGLTFVENRKIIQTKTWLIKPKDNYFDPFNISIHGITPQDVMNQPEFDIIWQEIKPLVENNLLIAHNAGFDMSVLRKTLETYQLTFPNLQYSCSYIFSKKVWENLPAYDLQTLCRIHNINLNHHDAGSDSRASAELSLKAFDTVGLQNFDEFPEKLKTTIGRLYENGYSPAESKREYRKATPKVIVGDPNKHNPESIFYGRTIAFTGTLSSMTRTEAQKLIADVGGTPGNTVNNSTDFLIIGQQDYRVVGDSGMSNKQQKAIKMIDKGAILEIISEEEFLRNL